MNKITSIDDINALIAAGVEESTTLEYKSDINTTSDKWKGEMSKDVSAMANAVLMTACASIDHFRPKRCIDLVEI